MAKNNNYAKLLESIANKNNSDVIKNGKREGNFCDGFNACLGYLQESIEELEKKQKKPVIDCLTIVKNKEDKDKFKSPYGNGYFILDNYDVAALLQGKTLAGSINEEYGVFITMEI